MRLAVSNFIRTISPYISFNSRLVRLAVHCSSKDRKRIRLFQFQIGAIGRLTGVPDAKKNPRFNSRLVRLAGRRRKTGCQKSNCFNSRLVRLVGLVAKVNILLQRSFNSRLVRLVVIIGDELLDSNDSFLTSTMRHPKNLSKNFHQIIERLTCVCLSEASSWSLCFH